MNNYTKQKYLNKLILVKTNCIFGFKSFPYFTSLLHLYLCFQLFSAQCFLLLLLRNILFLILLCMLQVPSQQSQLLNTNQVTLAPMVNWIQHTICQVLPIRISMKSIQSTLKNVKINPQVIIHQIYQMTILLPKLQFECLLILKMNEKPCKKQFNKY